MVIIVNSSISNKKLALFVVALGSFMMPFMGSSINVALPSIGKEFSIDAILLNWVTTAYFLASVMFLIPFGKIADIYGRKRIFAYGIVIFTIASLLTALSTSIFLLICFRFLQGIGGAMFFSTGVAIIASVSAPAERGKALGINVAIVFLGRTMGPFLGGMLTQNFGWRSIFYAIIPICLLLLALVFGKLEGEWAEASVKKFNYASSVIYSVSVLVFMYGFTVVPARSSIWLIAAGALCFIYYIWHETKVENPLVDINLFRKNTFFALSNLALLINFSATFAVVFLLSLYLQYIQMLTPQNAGLILISQSIAQGVISPIAGILSDRFAPRNIASIGMGITAVSLFLFAFLNSQTSLLYIIVVLAILGLGIGLFASPNTNAIMGAVDKEYYGVSSATLATMRQTGNLLSMALVMVIFALAIGRVEITPPYYAAFLEATTTAFIIFGIICCGGVAVSLARGKLRR